MDNYYAVLGVSRDADTREIKRRYKELIKTVHPDTQNLVNPRGWKLNSVEVEQEIEDNKSRFNYYTKAYDTLTNAEQRSQYDAELSRSQKKRNSIHSLR